MGTEIFCKEPQCVCEDTCCQNCEHVDMCQNKCWPVKYKEKIYNSDEFLIDELEKIADKSGNWLIGVAVERIKKYQQLKQSQ